MPVKKSYTRITLSLDIVRKIETGLFKGYHELGIVKHQIDLHDTISIEPAPITSIECDNPAVPIDNGNICRQAVDLLKSKYLIKENVKISLIKRIPVMGGLAGGSANAATMLQLLNELWKLNLSKDQLITAGRQLGMDVPYYFFGRTAFDSEATGILMPVKTDLQFVFILAIPEFGVSTKEAYGRIDYKEIGKRTELTFELQKCLQKNDFDGVAASMHNDFEQSVFKQYPKLDEIKKELIKAGCANAVMSGSGSTVLGIVKETEEAEEIRKKVPFKTLLCKTLL